MKSLIVGDKSTVRRLAERLKRVGADRKLSHL